MSPLDGVREVCGRLDEPLFGPNTFVWSALAGRADERGLGALIDGIDGDSTIDHGWQYPNVLWHQGRVRRAWREIRSMQRREGHALKDMLPMRMFGLEIDLAMRLYVLYTPSRLLPHLPGMMSRDLCERTRWFEQTREATRPLLRPVTDFNRLHHRNLTSGGLTMFVEELDHISHAGKVDHRHPYFDRRMLEFCLALPPEQRLHDGWDRVVQRRAFDGLVPKPIQFRHSKSVWTQVFERQLCTVGADRLRELSRHPDLAAFVDVPAMRRGIDELVRGKAGTLAMELWLAGSVARWLGVTISPKVVAS
jgi:asparagine synthase (glutamine-hydrolysing)